MGVGISTKGGAVTPAWFYNRPLHPAHVDVNDSEFGEHLLLCETCFPQLSWQFFWVYQGMTGMAF